MRHWIGLRKIMMPWIGLRKIMRSWIGLRKIMMRWIGLRKIMMRWIGLRKIMRSWIGLRKIMMRWITLRKIMNPNFQVLKINTNTWEKYSTTWSWHFATLFRQGYQSMYFCSLATIVYCTRQSAFLLNQSNMKMKSGLLADLMALHKIRRKVETTHT
jgi:hypothetical protein